MKKLIYLNLLLALVFACNNNSIEEKDYTEEYKAATVKNVGEDAPDFSITTLKGESFNTDNLKGKLIFINFFTLQCPMCMLELPQLEKEIWGKYKNREDIAILSIGREHSNNELNKFYTKKEFSFPMAADTNRFVYSLFAKKFVPRNIIIDKTGKIIFTKIGYNKDNGLTEIIDVLENELKD